MKYIILFAFVVLSFSLLSGSLIERVEAADIDIAKQYAPILYFEKDEKTFPVNISYHIDNSYLYQIGNDTFKNTSPTIEIISNISSSNYYLDNQQGTIKIIVTT